MAGRVAVISDTITTDQIFQIWYTYYSRLFGAKNLYLTTGRNSSSQFFGIELGGLWEIPKEFNDPTRVKVMSSLVAALLTTYDYVVRVDIDEFVVPDPRSAANLASYIDALDTHHKPYITGHGIEVVQTNYDSSLDYLSPILVQQRRFSYRNSSLNKICITSIPINWADGFHGGTVYPMISDLNIFRLKYADVTGRLKWFKSLIEHVPGNAAGQRYWSEGITELEAMQNFISRLVPLTGWECFDSHDFDERFLRTVKINPLSGHYQGTFLVDDYLREIPHGFSGML